jgi:phosphatidate phosphatase PAH1
VNGQTSDVSMKLGKAGEAYFFDETTGVSDEHFLQSRSLSSSLASSPVNGSIMSPPLGALDSVWIRNCSIDSGK